jgi:uncharacterized protein
MRPLLRPAVLLSALVLLATLLPALGASAGDVYPGAQYREEYFEMGDALGTRLHADLLRDEDVPWSRRQPVVLVVSPYTNHNGSTTDTDLQGGLGPNERFYDFLGLTDALEEGYTFAQVDLPGNGGSSGCNDWGGPVEQGAVKAAVEWAARQPWSNGRVALLGKSYDGWTGLMGMAQDPVGLAAVVSMEPVFSGYRYLYNNGVRFDNSVLTNSLFQVIDAKPGALNDDVTYHANGVPQVYCYGLNIALQQQDSEDVAFWAARDLVRHAAGSDVPLFLTQGWLETNTKPDAALAFWNALDHSHGENRAWFGQFDHVRGWDRVGGNPLNLAARSETGREDFAAQVLAFLDEHLKGVEGADDHLPAVEAQDNLGRYRAEAVYPPADVEGYTTTLPGGTYVDTSQGVSLFRISQPVDQALWLVGEPVVSLDVTSTVPRGNITVHTYDVAPDGRGVLVHRGSTLVRGVGRQQVDLPLYAQDWVVAEGHRIAVEIRGAEVGLPVLQTWWEHVPTGQTMTVTDADLTLPFQLEQRPADAFYDRGDGQSTSTPRLEQHNNRRTAIPASAQAVQFNLPQK